MSANEVSTIQPAKPRPEPKTIRTVDSSGEVLSSLTPELVIALCGPIGSPLHEAGDAFSSGLTAYGYTTEKIRLSDLISINAERVNIEVDRSGGRLNEIKCLIHAGDQLRMAFGNDILAKFSIAKIKADREARFGAFKDAVAENDAIDTQKISRQRVCHIIDSIKNRSELDLLRHVYGDALLAIGVFSPLEVRIANLENAGTNSISSDQVSQLIDIDSGEEFSHGQSVRDTFPRCDFFMRIDHSIRPPNEEIAVGQITTKVRRILGLVFKTSVITPTHEETAMYAAASAARNSACMSRQVGAAVASSSGELLSVGWNDVPQPGGGLYGKPSLDYVKFKAADDRCFGQPGSKCHNDEEKKGIAAFLGQTLVNEGLISADKLSTAIDLISKSRVRDLIEFSRAVHAEMHAILGAGRVAGERIVGGKIFVTTYPCHSCARHIVAAGIVEVHYIEPYRKSMATKLHKDALTESVSDESKVRLIQFDGVAPRRFIDVFEAGTRKQGGVLSLPPKEGAEPATQVSLKAIPRLEEVVVAELATKNLTFPPVSKALPQGS
ncbi:deoxycytidylate deaminase [Xanthomonas sacchari]|uniref:anti-phage dCTP deaminase n=1 Tax=Xanthomonas sacchari TaxID=56458 RepID=UPI00277F6FC3|nr:anti-phage dCTP deaminase [Xanthomonas sacchari]MDQ1090792.1 deoxycytidylate deaminase [Xanthomonas sacchari]